MKVFTLFYISFTEAEDGENWLIVTLHTDYRHIFSQFL